MTVEFLPLGKRDRRKPFRGSNHRRDFFYRRGRLIEWESGDCTLAVACHWCGWWLYWKRMTVDHVVPRAMGGHARAKTNLVPSCRACNSGRNEEFHRTPGGQEWLRLEVLRREVKGIFMRAAFAAAKHVVQSRAVCWMCVADYPLADNGLDHVRMEYGGELHRCLVVVAWNVAAHHTQEG